MRNLDKHCVRYLGGQLITPSVRDGRQSATTEAQGLTRGTHTSPGVPPSEPRLLACHGQDAPSSLSGVSSPGMSHHT